MTVGRPPESVSEHVGQRVLALRRARKWSRERLAQLLAAEGQAMGQNALWKIEQRPPERKITADEVAALAHVLEATPADLMGWAPRPGQPTEPDTIRPALRAALPAETLAEVALVAREEARAEVARLVREVGAPR